MRYRIGIAATLACAGVLATTAAAQTEMRAQSFAASAAAPLPALLVPDTTPRRNAVAPDPTWRFVRIVGMGTLAGAGAGLVVGAITTDGCQPDESWCILGWEEEVAIHGVAGAIVGAGVGAVYGLLSTPRYRSAEPAPISIAPAPGGGMRVGLALRH